MSASAAYEKSRRRFGDALKNIFAGALLAPTLLYGGSALYDNVPDTDKRLDELTKYYEAPCWVHVRANYTQAEMQRNSTLVQDCAEDAAFTVARREQAENLEKDLAFESAGMVSRGAGGLAFLFLLYNVAAAPVRGAGTLVRLMQLKKHAPQ